MPKTDKLRAKKSLCREERRQSLYARKSTLGTHPAIPEIIDDVLPAQAATLLNEYCIRKSIKVDKDITGRRDHIARLGFEQRFPGAETAKRELSNCDHEKFVAAETELRNLEERAAAMVVPALDALIQSFGDEPNEFALRREADLEKYGWPCSPTFQTTPI